MKNLVIIWIIVLASASCSKKDDPVPIINYYKVKIVGIRSAPETDYCFFRVESVESKVLPKDEIKDLCSKYTMSQEITISL